MSLLGSAGTASSEGWHWDVQTNNICKRHNARSLVDNKKMLHY
jgi:hypothetical protein